jgi:hypothetical protein
MMPAASVPSFGNSAPLALTDWASDLEDTSTEEPFEPLPPPPQATKAASKAMARKRARRMGMVDLLGAVKMGFSGIVRHPLFRG